MLMASLPILVETALSLKIESIKSYDFEDIHDTLSKVMPQVTFI